MFLGVNIMSAEFVALQIDAISVCIIASFDLANVRFGPSVDHVMSSQ